MAKKKITEPTLEEKLEQALVPNWDEPYKLPDNWCWVYLRGLLREIKNGTTIKQDKSGKGYSVTRIESLQNQTIDFARLGTIVDSEAIKETDWYIAGDIVLSHINSAEHVGKTALITERMLPLVHGMNLLRLRFFSILIPQLFQYYSQSFQYKESIRARINMAVNQVSINQKQIGSIEFPLPPIAEQERIVDRIESLFAKLDDVKEKAQTVLDSFEIRKAAILHKAFTGELTKKWRRLENIPFEGWLQQSLKECCDIGSGGTPSRKTPEYYDGYIPWIKTGEIDWNDIYDSEEHISQDAVDNSSAKVYPPGAVLVAMYGMGITRGRAAILKVEATTNQAVCVLQPKSYLLNRYLYYYFMCNYWDIREQAVGGNQLNLSGTIISKFIIGIPTIEEQKEIIKALDSLVKKEQQAKEAAEQVIDQIDTMKKSILARAFRGELGTNDPKDENAVKLLKRVLTDNNNSETKKQKKRTVIPAEISSQLSSELERQIIRTILKNDGKALLQELLSINSKKFDLLEAVRNLEKKDVIVCGESGEYTLKR